MSTKTASGFVKTQMGSTKMGVTQMGLTKMGVTQMGITKMGITKMGITKMGVTQMGITKMGITKIGTKIKQYLVRCHVPLFDMKSKRGYRFIQSTIDGVKKARFKLKHAFST